jgi:PRC-barrel domain
MKLKGTMITSLLTSTTLGAALVFSGAAIAQTGQTQGVQQQTGPNAAQQGTQQQPKTRGTGQQAGQQEPPPVILLSDWNYDTIYSNGWSVDRLMDEADVFGPTGEEIGSVENVIIGDNGRALGIVAQVGGFLDIGDTHVFVPWDQLRISPGLERVTIPVTAENVEEYSTWADGYLTKPEAGQTQAVESDLATGPRAWKATELLRDDAFLTDNTRYGAINDLIFTADGTLHAVVVNASANYGGGDRAFPFYGYGYGWAPGYPSYYLGYDRAAVTNLEPFDYDKMNRRVAIQNDGRQSRSQ